MHGEVSKLYDIDSIVIPQDLLTVNVDEQQIADEVAMLGTRYAKESQADTVEEGDLVYAKADQTSYPDRRTILIYTGLELPGAENATVAVLGKNKGDVISTEVAGKAATLTIEKILRRTPVEVTDDLVVGMGINGVTNLETYQTYLRDKKAADQQMEKSKEVAHFIIDQMVELSTYTYDEAEMDAHVQIMMEQYQKEMEQYGEEMGMEDVSPEEVRKGIIEQEKQTWMVKAFCESKGLEADLSSVEEDTDRMMEMMQLMGEEIPDRAEMIEMAIQDAYFNEFLNYIEQMVAQKKGGSHGNC